MKENEEGTRRKERHLTAEWLLSHAAHDRRPVPSSHIIVPPLPLHLLSFTLPRPSSLSLCHHSHSLLQPPRSSVLVITAPIVYNFNHPTASPRPCDDSHPTSHLPLPAYIPSLGLDTESLGYTSPLCFLNCRYSPSQQDEQSQTENRDGCESPACIPDCWKRWKADIACSLGVKVMK
jgi:hypothetical protein